MKPETFSFGNKSQKRISNRYDEVEDEKPIESKKRMLCDISMAEDGEEPRKEPAVFQKRLKIQEKFKISEKSPIAVVRPLYLNTNIGKGVV